MNKVNKIVVIMGVLILLSFVLLSFGEAAVEKSILRWNDQSPLKIDPGVVDEYSGMRATRIIYDSLVYPDKKGEPQPSIAKTWENSSDGKTWVFHLRSDIKFHDGTELTAEDVKFSLDRLLTMGTGYAYALLDIIKRVEVLDDYTIKFYLMKPYGPLLATLYRVLILNKDLVMSNIEKPGNYGELGDYGQNFLLNHDAGSGPYLVEKYPTQEYLLMKKFTNYWGYMAPKAPDEVKIILTTESIAVRTAMANRELEISDQWQSLNIFNDLDKIKGIDIAATPMGCMYYFMMNTKRSPLDDIHFRKAIAWAVDYDTLGKEVYAGYVQARGPIPHYIAGFDPTVFQYHFDLTKSLEELKKSKYYNKLDQYTIKLVWCSDAPDQKNVALSMQADLYKVGINAEVVGEPWLLIADQMTKQETSPDLVLLSCSASYPEAGSLLKKRYASSLANTNNQNEWLLDSKFDTMIEDAISTINTNERYAKYSKLQHYIMDLCPSIFLFEDATLHAYQSAYVDWPAAKGENIPVVGCDLDPRWIQVYPNKRAELLK